MLFRITAGLLVAFLCKPGYNTAPLLVDTSLEPTKLRPSLCLLLSPVLLMTSCEELMLNGH